jgi:acyl carrier protein
MTNAQVRKRVRDTMASVFNLAPAALQDESSPDSIPGWDSVGQVNLIMALEQEFGISFSDEQSVELRSFELVVCLVADALAAKKP